MAHVFISYMREDQKIIDRLIKTLADNGVKVWIDRNDLEPGVRWQTVIRNAIKNGSYFLPCFSKTRTGSEDSYANVEMKLALAELKKGKNKSAWFIPIKLDAEPIPPIPINESETLQDLQYVDIHNNWPSSIEQLLSALYLPEFELQKKIFSQLERLIAIYSLVYWRSPKQEPPEILQDGELGNRSFTLSCENIKWGSEVPGDPGELFDCFRQRVTHNITSIGEPFEACYFTPDEDFWYSFQWQSLFRYELNVMINPSHNDLIGDFYNLQETLRKKTWIDGENEGHPIPIFSYVVKIDGLRYGKSTGFLVADGYMLTSVDGYNHKRDEWVIYLNEEVWYTEQQLRNAIEYALEWKKIRERTLEHGLRVLESEWKGRYPYFNNDFLNEIKIDFGHFE